MRTIRAALAAIALASAFPALGEDEGSPPPAADAVELLRLDADRAHAVAAILERASKRDRAVEAQFGDTHDPQSLAILHLAKQAIRQDCDQRLAQILSDDEMVLLGLIAPAAPSDFGTLRFVGI